MDIPVMEKLNDYIELLYESDAENQNKGASQILELAQVADNIETLCLNSPLINSLIRLLKDPTSRNSKLAMTILFIFFCVTRFSQFLPVVVGMDVTNIVLDIVNEEIAKDKKLNNMLNKHRQVVAAGPAGGPNAPSKGELVKSQQAINKGESKLAELRENQAMLFYAAFHLLHNIADIQEEEDVMVESGIIQQLFSMLEFDSVKYVDLISLVIVFLKRLSISEKNQSVMVRMKVTDRLLPALMSPDAHIVDVALRLFNNLSFNPTIRAEMIHRRVIGNIANIAAAPVGGGGEQGSYNSSNSNSGSGVVLFQTRELALQVLFNLTQTQTGIGKERERDKEKERGDREKERGDEDEDGDEDGEPGGNKNAKDKDKDKEKEDEAAAEIEREMLSNNVIPLLLNILLHTEQYVKSSSSAGGGGPSSSTPAEMTAALQNDSLAILMELSQSVKCAEQIAAYNGGKCISDLCSIAFKSKSAVMLRFIRRLASHKAEYVRRFSTVLPLLLKLAKDHSEGLMSLSTSSSLSPFSSASGGSSFLADILSIISSLDPEMVDLASIAQHSDLLGFLLKLMQQVQTKPGSPLAMSSTNASGKSTLKKKRGGGGGGGDDDGSDTDENTEICMEIVRLVGSLSAVPELMPAFAKTRWMKVLLQLVKEKYEDNDLVINCLYVFYNFLISPETLPLVMQDPNMLIGLYLSVVYDAGDDEQLASIADAALDIIASQDPKLRLLVRQRKFEIYNKAWLEYVKAHG